MAHSIVKGIFSFFLALSPNLQKERRCLFVFNVYSRTILLLQACVESLKFCCAMHLLCHDLIGCCVTVRFITSNDIFLFS
uniref:Uncharacterized protein n=1 Tax=Rhizophora mucronata TaxID=61149 RepID=A0A2P2N6L2_RHIMU